MLIVAVVCLDVGASTQEFTDCLLQRGRQTGSFRSRELQKD
jgi:predicted rRNA methylase YqxC with S4 and FtsJ domains